MKLIVTILFVILIVTISFFVKNYSVEITQFFSPNSDSKTIDSESSEKIFISSFQKFISSQTFKDYSGQDLSDVPFNEKLKNSEVVIIHFWASWCAPCVNEVPELISFKNRIFLDGSVSKQKILFVTVSLDEDSVQIEKFIKSFKDFGSSDFIKIWDKSSVFSKYFNVDRLPMTVVLSKSEAPRYYRGVADWQKMVF